MSDHTEDTADIADGVQAAVCEYCMDCNLGLGANQVVHFLASDRDFEEDKELVEQSCLVLEQNMGCQNLLPAQVKSVDDELESSEL